MRHLQRRLRQAVSILAIAATMLGVLAPQAASAGSPLPTARLERTLYLTAFPGGNGATAVTSRTILLNGGNYHWHVGLAVTDGSSPFYVARSEANRNLYLQAGWYSWRCFLTQGWHTADQAYPVGSYALGCDLETLDVVTPMPTLNSTWFWLAHSGDYKMASYLDPL